MRFSWDFLLNMLENDDSNLQKKVWSACHLKYFQNNQILKSWDYTPPPNLTLKADPTPGGGGRFEIFSLK